VFVPAAFITGLTGQFYRQFALTIAISTIISAFNSLTLSPALAAVLPTRPRGTVLIDVGATADPKPEMLVQFAQLGVAYAQPGDAIIVSGPIGDHGITIMLARGELDIEADVVSDTAPLNGLITALLDEVPGVRAMRDATRGGVATILNEIARAADVGVLVSEDAIPVRDEVRGACELLGIDPMYVACEGRLVAVVDGAEAEAALDAMHAHPLGVQAAVIGHVTGDSPGLVHLKTAFGGTRIVDLLVGDPLPRIC